MRLWLATPASGVLLDCGRRDKVTNQKTDDDWWLDLYVMLSRATRLEDLLLIRAPAAEFLLQGPPASLALQLQELSTRVRACRNAATTTARELGFEQFFHEDSAMT